MIILTLNCGSSSIKFSVYETGDSERMLCRGQLERIGVSDSRMEIHINSTVEKSEPDLPDHETALHHLLSWLDQQSWSDQFSAVGHRVVHGGPRYQNHASVDDAMLTELRRLQPFDPLHLPSEIRAIEILTNQRPGLTQIACFDTVFHAEIPEVARWYAIPASLAQEGIHRYGFHGLSYEWIYQRLGAMEPATASQRIVIAHLGSGASMAAIRNGKCVDTTMGFTPLAGLVMGTRCGDIDPGVLLYLLAEKGMSVEHLSHLLNHESGLLGVSGISSDVRELLAKMELNPDAKRALDVFHHQARRQFGALTATLGGLDVLVFTAGIGEHSPDVRREICSGLEYLGVQMDAERNNSNEAIISREGSGVVVRVIPTDEERMLVQHVSRLVRD